MLVYKAMIIKDYEDFYSRCETVKKFYQKFYEGFKYTNKIEKYRLYIENHKNMIRLQKVMLWEYINDDLPRTELRPPKFFENKKRVESDVV